MKELEKVKKLLKENKRSRPLAENIVIEYNNHFYKAPNYSAKYLFYKWIDSYSFVKKSYQLLKEKFWDDFKIVETQIFKDKNFQYIIKQKKIEGRILEKKDLKEKIVKEKIEHLLKKNKALWKKQWFFLDILGTESLYNPSKMHNIFICENKDLYIFDFWLLNKNAKSYTFRFFSYLFYFIQSFWLEKILLRNI